jgi:uncharacterized protein with PQ loop repeat
VLHTALSAAAVMASFAFSIAPVLQTVKIVRQRSAKAVSLGSFLLSIGCLAVWDAYGTDIRNLPLIISTSLEVAANVAVVVAILVMKSRRV